MRTPFPEKVLKILDDLEENDSVPLKRLMVIQEWFAPRSTRRKAFGIWIARHSAARKGKTKGEAGALLNEARALLGGTSSGDTLFKAVDPEAAISLLERARSFPDCRPLVLVAKGLAVHLELAYSAENACQLAMEWAQNKSTTNGVSFSGPSYGKLHELMRWMFDMEALEDHQ